MDFIKEHFGFILTMTVTYVLGVFLIVVQYISTISSMSSGSEVDIDIFKFFLDSLIPTTITYVLGCVLVNIADSLKEKSDSWIFNIVTCLCVFLYAIIFCIYLMVGFSLIFAVAEVVVTILLLVLNVFCYKERYNHRNHNLN